MSDICEIIITAPDPDWLADFTYRLVEDRLVAGGHVHERVRSVYRWNGAIHDRGEARVALHTRREHFASILSRTQAEHPYEVPCIIELIMESSSDDYRAWVLEQTNLPSDNQAASEQVEAGKLFE